MLVHSSSLLQRILLEAHCSGTKFKVIVVDGRPWREGLEMLRRLVQCGLNCSYVLVSAASFIMREVCKVKQHDEQGCICCNYRACLVTLTFTVVCHFNVLFSTLQKYLCYCYDI
jgi:hypothetical protein